MTSAGSHCQLPSTNFSSHYQNDLHCCHQLIFQQCQSPVNINYNCSTYPSSLTTTTIVTEAFCSTQNDDKFDDETTCEYPYTDRECHWDNNFEYISDDVLSVSSELTNDLSFNVEEEHF